MKKRLFAVLLAAVLSVSAFAGCSGSAPAPAPAAAESPAGGTASADPSPAQTADELGTPLADVRVRQALAYAIDIDAIVESIFKGKADAATSMTAPGDWLAADLPDYKYDPEKAKALLAEANWPADYTLDVVYYYDDQQTVDLMTVIGQYWSNVGVKAQFRKLEGDLAAQLWVAPADRVNGPSDVKWDLAYAAVSALVEHEFYDRFSSEATNNSSVPKVPELDELIVESNSNTDISVQKDVFKKIQKLVADNVYNMPLYHQVVFVYTSDKINTGSLKHGNDQFSYEKNVLDWTTTRDDGMIYTNGGPLEFFSVTNVNPGQYLYQEFVLDRLINADSSLNPTDGMLAESYSISDDQKTMEFILRDGLKWHDGQPLTPEDVKFTIELLSKVPGTNSIASGTFRSIKGAQAYVDGAADGIDGVIIDGNKITVEFETIAANALSTFSQWPVLPKHLLQDADPNALQQHSYWQKPIGSGPFMVDEVVLNNYSTLTRWDGYYKTGTGNVQKIYMHASGETDANLVKNAQAGLIDYAYNKSTDDAAAVEVMDGMAVNVANVRYTRCFYINQFPHEANIK